MSESDNPDSTTRRGFVGATSTILMGAGLAASYGTLGGMAGRFLYPADGTSLEWQMVTTTDRLSPGDSLVYKTPAGAPVVVARQGSGDTADDFVAMSSVCPHLGCQVHWEPQNHRYFCPCHNGAFDPQGRATEGPPADAGQSLLRFPIRVENGLLLIAVPTRAVGQMPLARHDRAEGDLA